MGKSRLGVCGAVAFVATYGLFNVVTAQAATLQESITLTASANDIVTVLSTSAFNEFNPALGQLISVDAGLTGEIGYHNDPSLVGTNIPLQVDLVFHGTNETIGNATQTFPGWGSYLLTVNGSTSDTLDMSNFLEGTGTTVLDLSLDNGSFVCCANGNFLGDTFNGSLIGHVTYTYIPVATPLPAALPLFAGGLGGLGLLGWRRKRKVQTVA